MSHPRRRHIHVPRTFGDRVADAVPIFFGTWGAVGAHTLWFVAWFLRRLGVDILTNAVSLEAIYLSIFILMSQRRSDAKDRVRDDHEAATIDELHGMNVKQLEILIGLHNVQTTLADHVQQTLPK